MIERRRFTPIELSVVISIVALLLSILVPALGEVKEQTNRVKCLASLKQGNRVCVEGRSEGALDTQMARELHHPRTLDSGGWREGGGVGRMDTPVQGSMSRPGCYACRWANGLGIDRQLVF